MRTIPLGRSALSAYLLLASVQRGSLFEELLTQCQDQEVLLVEESTDQRID